MAYPEGQHSPPERPGLKRHQVPPAFMEQQGSGSAAGDEPPGDEPPANPPPTGPPGDPPPPGWAPPPPPQPPRRKHTGLIVTLSVVGGLIVIGAVASALGAGTKGPSLSTPGTALPSASVQAASPSPSPVDTQFVSDMRTTFSFDSGVSDDDLSTFGQQTCEDLQGNVSFPEEVSSARQQWSNTNAGDGIQMVRLAEQDICPDQLKRQTITYLVTGNVSADVTYGPSGSNLQGSVPMKVTKHLGSPQYYAIDAQLNGNGTVHCKLKVDGVTISSSTASGAYNIASCQIGQNPITNSWENEN